MAVTQTTPQAAVRRANPNPAPETHAGENPAPSSIVAVLGRLTWMLFGPIALFLVTLRLFDRHPSLFGLADGAYFVALGAVLWGRRVEFRRGAALTAAGEPATEADLRRYLRWTALIGLAVWATAKLVGALWLSP
jgi:hypothetical protein